MEDIGYLKMQDDRYEFHYPELGLVVRGPFAEWVLEAAGEIIGQTAELTAQGTIEELKMLVEFGEEEETVVDSAQFDADARFQAVPQCVVTMGRLDYHWVAPEGREGETGVSGALKRIHVMSKTRNDSFLKNVDGVDTTG
ncbi:MAG: hypothetical protein AAGI34_11235 [Pseudomonadota bacterium]